MDKLTSDYWKKFEHIVDGKLKKDGEVFEALVADMLALMYRQEQIRFEPTPTTHDGSKDFVGSRDGRDLIWAECKNYRNTVSLTQVAPTLVMAEIYGIQQVLFFSYSELSHYARWHLCRYVGLPGKSLTLYDGEALESLILSLGAPILSKYFPDYRPNAAENRIVRPYLSCGLEKDPDFRPPELDESEGIDVPPGLSSISIGEVFCMNVTAVNRDAVNPIQIKVSFPPVPAAPDDIFSFTFLDERIHLAGGKNQFTFELLPGRAKFERVFFRYSKYKPFLYPPMAEISAMDAAENELDSVRSDIFRIQTNWSRKAVFSGSGYEAVLKSFQETCVDCSHFGGLLLYGKSGVGKSRLLEECTGILLSRQYKLLNFTGWEKHSALDIVKELTYILFGLTDEMILDSLTDDVPEKPYSDKPAIQKALRLLKGLQSGAITKDNVEEHYSFILEKLMQDGWTLIIDNVQYFDADFLSFLRKMTGYGINRRRSAKSLLLCSINLDQISDDSFSEFIGEFDDLASAPHSRFLCRPVRGFQDELQAVSFLASILRMPVARLDSPQLRSALARCSLRPKYIEELADYLIQEKNVILAQEDGVIPEPVLFLETISNLPPKFEELFEIRYAKFVKRGAESADCLSTFLSMTHLLRAMDADAVLNFGLSIETAKQLVCGGILKCERLTGTSQYIFEHDLIEQYFMSAPAFSSYAVQHLKKAAPSTLALLEQKYPAQYALYCFSTENTDTECARKLFDKMRHMLIPSNIRKEFFLKLSGWLVLLHTRGGLTDSVFLEYASKCCIHIRDFISEDAASIAFGKCYTRAVEIELTSVEVLKGHFAFVLHYCENRNHLNSAKIFRENLDLYRSYYKLLQEKIPEFPQAAREIQYACAYLQNRMFICGKHLGCCAEFEDGLQNAIRIGEAYDFPDILFSAYFDRSSAYLYENPPRALNDLETGIRIFEKNRYPKFELNYFKKKIQYDLMTHNLGELSKAFRDAFACLKTSPDIRYHTYFRNCLLYLKTVYLMLNGAPLPQICQTMDDLKLSQLLLSKNSDYAVLLLSAKLAVRSDSLQEAVTLFRRALSKCRKSAAAKGYLRDRFNCAVIEEELLRTLQVFGMEQLDDLTRAALREELGEKAWSAVTAYGLKKPPRRKHFRSKAFIISDDGQEGFLL